MKRRVVITGIGVVSPLGLDTSSTWDGLLGGTSGVGPITKFDTEGYTCRIAGEVRGFDPENYLDRRDARKMDTFTHYAVAATREALINADLVIDSSNAERISRSMSASGATPTIVGVCSRIDEHGTDRLSG